MNHVFVACQLIVWPSLSPLMANAWRPAKSVCAHEYEGFVYGMNVIEAQINVSLMVDGHCDYNLFVQDYIMQCDKLSPYSSPNDSMRHLWCYKWIHMEIESFSVFMCCRHEIGQRWVCVRMLLSILCDAWLLLDCSVLSLEESCGSLS